MAAPSGRALAGAFAVACAWIAWGLVRHPGFQPAPLLRTAAPLLALAAGGGFARLVALARERVDAAREIDRGGKALFMGFVMVGATFVAWLLISQALPAGLNGLVGAAAAEAGVVTARPAESADPDCGHRLVVASAASGAGAAVPQEHAQDECVPPELWRSASERGPVSLRLVRSVFGAELVGVEAAR